MSNMSHCRFYNTDGDLADVAEDLDRRACGAGEDEDGDPLEPLSRMEEDAAVSLIMRCADIIGVVIDDQGLDGLDDLTRATAQKFVDEMQADARRMSRRREAIEEAPARRGDYVIVDGEPRRVVDVTVTNEDAPGEELVLQYHLADGRVLGAEDFCADDVKLESEVGVDRR